MAFARLTRGGGIEYAACNPFVPAPKPDSRSKLNAILHQVDIDARLLPAGGVARRCGTGPRWE